MTDHALPAPHPAFARHFTDPVYADEGDEFAPFGNDEGSDLLHDWIERPSATLDGESSIATVLECSPEEVATYAGPMEGIDGLDTVQFIVSAAFVLLRFTGRIPDDDRALALRALELQAEVLPLINPDLAVTPAALLTQQRDLASWRNP